VVVREEENDRTRSSSIFPPSRVKYQHDRGTLSHAGLITSYKWQVFGGLAYLKAGRQPSGDPWPNDIFTTSRSPKVNRWRRRELGRRGRNAKNVLVHPSTQIFLLQSIISHPSLAPSLPRSLPPSLLLDAPRRRRQSRCHRHFTIPQV
jgi:hypothetical protein